MYHQDLLHLYFGLFFLLQIPQKFWTMTSRETHPGVSVWTSRITGFTRQSSIKKAKQNKKNKTGLTFHPNDRSPMYSPVWKVPPGQVCKSIMLVLPPLYCTVLITFTLVYLTWLLFKLILRFTRWIKARFGVKLHQNIPLCHQAPPLARKQRSFEASRIQDRKHHQLL